DRLLLITLFVSVPHTTTTQLATLSLHDALPIFAEGALGDRDGDLLAVAVAREVLGAAETILVELPAEVAHADHAAAEDQRHHERSEEHTSELQSREKLVCRLLLEKKKYKNINMT